MTTPDPLAGPFLTRVQLCDYSDEPGWAIPPRDTEPAKEGDR
jgi:hypothetical protein